MQQTRALLVASTALTASIGQPARSAMPAPVGVATTPAVGRADGDWRAAVLFHVSDDDHDDDRAFRSSRHDEDDDHEGDDDRGARNPPRPTPPPHRGTGSMKAVQPRGFR